VPLLHSGTLKKRRDGEKRTENSTSIRTPFKGVEREWIENRKEERNPLTGRGGSERSEKAFLGRKPRRRGPGLRENSLPNEGGNSWLGGEHSSTAEAQKGSVVNGGVRSRMPADEQRLRRGGKEVAKRKPTRSQIVKKSSEL